MDLTKLQRYVLGHLSTELIGSELFINEARKYLNESNVGAYDVNNIEDCQEVLSEAIEDYCFECKYMSNDEMEYFVDDYRDDINKAFPKCNGLSDVDICNKLLDYLYDIPEATLMLVDIVRNDFYC